MQSDKLGEIEIFYLFQSLNFYLFQSFYFQQGFSFPLVLTWEQVSSRNLTIIQYWKKCSYFVSCIILKDIEFLLQIEFILKNIVRRQNCVFWDNLEVIFMNWVFSLLNKYVISRKGWMGKLIYYHSCSVYWTKSRIEFCFRWIR